MNTTKRNLLYLLALVLLAIPVIEWARVSYLSVQWPTILYDASRLLAVLGFVVLFFQYVLASRVRAFESSLGLDRLIHVHRKTGIAALALLFLHGVLYSSYELVRGFLTLGWQKLLGIGALVLLIAVAGAAILWKSLGWRYETWKRVHYASYVILPLGFLHALLLGTTVSSSPVTRIYFIVLLALYVLVVASRIVKRLQVRANPYTVSDVRRESHDVVSLRFNGPVPAFAPGQFMIVNLFRGSGYSESHPYTISSGPDEEHLRLSAKGIGDFSRSLAEVAPGTRALIEAPYGVFSYDNAPGDSLVFIAGGIGITPFLGQLSALRSRGEQRKVRLIWGNKTRDDIAFADELDAAGEYLDDFALVHVLSNDEWDGETGFVDESIVRKYVDDVDRAQFFVCGPPIMMEKLIPTLRDMGVSDARLHYERFALG
ncbi:MAG: ferric reductase-like transmembrane domain-containing protein [Spirochaetota bacterium]